MDRRPTDRPTSIPRGARHLSLLVLFAFLALGACTSASPTSPTSTAATAIAPADAPSATAAPAPTPTRVRAAVGAFPVTLTDDEGTSLTLDAAPERIISLSPANTETVFALGGGDALVGGTDFDDFPPEAADLPDVATFTGVLMEQVIDLEPDLVLAAGNGFTPPADIERMRELGFPVLVVYAGSVDGVLADIELIGRALGKAAEATELTRGMRSRIEQVGAATDDLSERPRVFYQIGSEPEIYAPAPGSFIADMVEMAGGDPITTTDPAIFSIPVEQLVTADPEVIVVGDAAYGVCPEHVAARSGWREMTAVREGAVRPIEDTIVTRPGPRLAEGLAALAVAIDPDLDLAPAPPPATFCAP